MTHFVTAIIQSHVIQNYRAASVEMYKGIAMYPDLLQRRIRALRTPLGRAYLQKKSGLEWIKYCYKKN